MDTVFPMLYVAGYKELKQLRMQSVIKLSFGCFFVQSIQICQFNHTCMYNCYHWENCICLALTQYMSLFLLVILNVSNGFYFAWQYPLLQFQGGFACMYITLMSLY